MLTFPRGDKGGKHCRCPQPCRGSGCHPLAGKWTHIFLFLKVAVRILVYLRPSLCSLPIRRLILSLKLWSWRISWRPRAAMRSGPSMCVASIFILLLLAPSFTSPPCTSLQVCSSSSPLDGSTGLLRGILNLMDVLTPPSSPMTSNSFHQRLLSTTHTGLRGAGEGGGASFTGSSTLPLLSFQVILARNQGVTLNVLLHNSHAVIKSSQC